MEYVLYILPPLHKDAIRIVAVVPSGAKIKGEREGEDYNKFSQTFDGNAVGTVETGDLAGDKYCGIHISRVICTVDTTVGTEQAHFCRLVGMFADNRGERWTGGGGRGCEWRCREG
jgi:hypothetical protein